MRRLLTLLALTWAGPAWAEAELLGRLSLSGAPAFIGVSGLEVSADGTEAWLLTDKGLLSRAILSRDGDRLSGIELHDTHALLFHTGEPLQDFWTDSEGLAMPPEGPFFVSFERHARVMEYPAPDAASTWLPRPPEIAAMNGNGGPEALAIDAGGALYLLQEDAGGADTAPIWRFADRATGWQPVFDYRRDGAFYPSGADFGPDGRLYVLERAFINFRFAVQVRRLDLATGTDEVVLRTARGVEGNLEGLAVWRDAAGATRLLLVTDNNGLDRQRNEIVEYRLTEPGPRG
ncbi:MAG: hypothetical protein HLUCCA08_10795 [Rhodobacteraceae bacterium HLUCCA08]|nr:MAG: hypothetical protein HLUCCA08_10795 [Rhodobacteraceae bacterium HLUCCA08]